MKPYEIILKNCSFFAHHGVFKEETALGQRFFIDAVLTVDPKDALEKDEIENTVHYGLVFAAIENIVINERYYLIEAMALKIAKKLCEDFSQILNAKITVRKPSAPVPGILDHVEVTVEHSK
jgi:dihydroneopterin aldolase